MIRPSPKQVLYLLIPLFAAGVSAFFLSRPLRTEPIQPVSLETSPEKPRPERAIITWTPTSVETTVSPSETVSPAVSFVSSKNIRRAEVQVSRELASIARPEPAVLERVRKGERRTIQLVVSSSATTALGTYTGTIQIVREKVDKDDDDDYDREERGKPLAQSLPVIVNVWQSFASPHLGLEIKLPPGFTAFQPETDGEQQVLNLIQPGQTRPEYGGDITVFLWPNPDNLSTQEFFDGEPGPNIFGGTLGGTEVFAVNGNPATKFKNVIGISTMEIVVIRSSNSFLEFQVAGSRSVFDQMLKTLKITR